MNQLSAAVLNDGPGDVAQLVWTLENRPLGAGRGRPDQQEVMVMYVRGLSAVYRLVGAGTSIEVLEVRGGWTS